jgi:hypothetical protein
MPAVFTGLLVNHIEGGYIISPRESAALRRRSQHFIIQIMIILVIIISDFHHLAILLSRQLRFTLSIALEENFMRKIACFFPHNRLEK